MKIDIYAHILPEKYMEHRNKVVPVLDKMTEQSLVTANLPVRLKFMERYPDVLQVLTVSRTPADAVLAAGAAIELARIANDEMAEILVKHPDKFVAGVACLPLNDADAAVKEAERAITQLGLKGIELLAQVNGAQLGDRKYKPLYEMMARYDLPIWIHPCSDDKLDESIFGWPFATSWAMKSLVTSGVFRDFPGIKFITHHCGAMVPFFADRVKWLYPLNFKLGDPARDWAADFQKFYNDTATYGYTPSLMCGYAYFGADHLLFGTDSPRGPHWGLTQETIDSIQRMDIPDEDKEKIFIQNAVRLLKVAL